MVAVGNLMNINLTLLWSCPLMNINNSKLLYWKRKETNFHSCWKKKHQYFLTFKSKIPLKIAEKKWSVYPCFSADALLLAMGNYNLVVLLKKMCLKHQWPEVRTHHRYFSSVWKRFQHLYELLYRVDDYLRPDQFLVYLTVVKTAWDVLTKFVYDRAHHLQKNYNIW